VFFNAVNFAAYVLHARCIFTKTGCLSLRFTAAKNGDFTAKERPETF